MTESYWLLDLTIDTQTVRLAEVPLDVTTIDGMVLHYEAGVAVEPVTEAISLLGASVSVPEAQLTVYLPGVSALAILRATGSLSRWAEGTVYERRRVVIVGALQSPVQSGPEEGIETTLSQDVWIDPGAMIGRPQIVSDATWSTLATVTDGDGDIAYPTVIGLAGRVESSLSMPALVAPRIDATLGQPAAIVPNWNGAAYLLAGHHLAATWCKLSTETDIAGKKCRVLNTFDDQGQPVAVAPWYWSAVVTATGLTPVPEVLAYSAANTYTFVSGSNYGVGADALPDAYNVDAAQPAVYAAIEEGGGLVWDGEVLRRAGDVLGWALARSGVSADRIQIVGSLPALQAYLIDTVIAERVSPWDWITQVLLPILPCCMAAGPDGLFIVPLLLDATEADVEARIDTSRPDVARVSGPEWDTSHLAGTVTVYYSYDVRRSVYARRVVYGSSAAAAADSTGETIAHATLTAGASLRAARADLEVSTAAIGDLATAHLVASTLARVWGLPIGTMIFDLPEADPRFSALRRGSIVYVADEDTGIGRIAQVSDIVTGGDSSLVVSVWLLLDPTRDTLT